MELLVQPPGLVTVSYTLIIIKKGTEKVLWNCDADVGWWVIASLTYCDALFLQFCRKEITAVKDKTYEFHD
jgi:hypothetical protein